ncbi:hypothetical protein [Variovorax atrisoli]|uniref:hypothetical protein n=1 Tax=Variovorax atrisoli TaxID=3394203 RepID=UPI0012FE4CE2|nr:hypothetical protein [Variovorax paradoxus]
MKRIASRSLMIAVSLLGTGALTGCVSVRVSGSDPRISYGIGFVNIHFPADGNAPLMVATDGLGLVASTRSLTIGAVKERVAAFPHPSACHTMVVVQSSTQFDALMRLLKEEPQRLGDLCVVNEERP